MAWFLLGSVLCGRARGNESRRDGANMEGCGMMRLSRSNAARRAVGWGQGWILGAAAACLLVVPAWANGSTEDAVVCSGGEADCGGVEHRIKILIAGGGDELEGLAAGGEAIDISGMEVGETRYGTGDTDVAVTRVEDGYTITVDGEEIHVDTIVDADRMKVIVGSGSGEGGSWTTADGSVFSLDGHHVALFGAGGESDAVTLSGLGDLDEDARQRIIEALRDAGVEKDIHFADGHGFQFITAGTGEGNTVFFSGDEGGEGEHTINVDVEAFAGDEAGTHKVVIIKKVKSGDQEK
ncbi:MAG: hypothetical protein ACE5IK_13055 [Acidobacteriota bacterium]